MIATVCLLSSGLIVSCIGSDTVDCDWGLICPPGTVCHGQTETCVSDKLVEACDGKSELEDCIYPGSSVLDRCVEGVCVTPICGDGVVDSVLGEVCDDGINDGTACSPGCDQNILLCGNEVIDLGEVCDGIALGGQTCLTLGFVSGVLQCSPDCASHDTETCKTDLGCGNGYIDSGEQCDGDDLGGETCLTLGFAFAGLLSCEPNCTFDVSNCICIPDCTGYSCGQVEATCGTTCGNACDAGCTAHCSNGVQDCDETGTDCGGASCAACSCIPDCTGYSCGQIEPTCGTACGSACDWGCTAHCSNGVQDCDETGVDCGGASCAACPSGCGNHVIDATEACDGTDLAGETCLSQGFMTGQLTCDASCLFDLTTCLGGCGNSLVEATEACDGTDLNEQDCVSMGFSSGQLTCDASCLLDPSGCLP